MPDSLNKAVFEIPSNLSALNSLPLQDTLKVLFSPFAKSTVVLLDEAGGWILAKVNGQSTLLKGTELVSFLESQGSLRLEVSHIGENYFRFITVRDIPELIQEEQTATQLSLDFGIEGPDRAGNTEIPIDQPIAKPQEPIKESEVIKVTEPSRPISQTQHAPAGMIKSPSPSKGALSNRFNEVVHDNITSRVKDKDKDNAIAKVIGKGKGKGKAKGKGETLANNSLKETKKKDNNSVERIQTTSVVLPESSLPTEPQLPSQKGHSLVKILFHTTEDAQVLQEVKAGHFSRTSDFYLRQQALKLSVSPGFEVLMALKATRLLQAS